MARLASLLAAALALTGGVVRGHFTLQYPAPLGNFDEEKEGTSPCGGQLPNLESADVTDFHVGGDAVSVNTAHPHNLWLYRFTVDSKAADANWTQLYPIVSQTGVNTYCQPAVTVPENLVGHKAILSVVGKASDGLLYQCAVVNFVPGIGSKPEACSNSTGVSASFANDAELAGLVGHAKTEDNSSAGSPSSSAPTAPTTASAASPTETPGAAALAYGSTYGLRALITISLMVALGAGLLA